MPYRGGALVMTDLLGNQINLASMGLPAVLANIRAGKIVALAVSSERRVPQLPDVPAMKEAVPDQVFFDFTWPMGCLGQQACSLGDGQKRVQERPESGDGHAELVCTACPIRVDGFVGSTAEETANSHRA